jgi:hypothetical protein
VIARVVLRQRASGQKIVEVMMMMVACGYRIEFALSQLTIAHVYPVEDHFSGQASTPAPRRRNVI